MEVRRHFVSGRPIPPAALTIGNFDGVHLGHQAMLGQTVATARALGIAACVLTFEPHPREFFAPDQAPARLTSLREKLELFEFHGIDRVQLCRFDYRFAQISGEMFIEQIMRRGINAKWVLVGEDFRFGARRGGDFTLLKQASLSGDFELKMQPLILVDGDRVSSTGVRECLATGNMERARRLLGRPYSMQGRVVRNDQFGRKLGFPTANVLIKHNRPPLKGIYAVEVEGVDERPWPGVASLGVRPTVSRDLRPLLEVHLLDFDRDIYGTRLRVDFLHKFRDEEKYADVQTLKSQIARDVDDAREYLSRKASVSEKRSDRPS